jgi:nucleotide-binding universal stress UspA family protein
MSNKKIISYPIESILVGLDLTEMDTVMIKYASTVCQYFPINEVYFYHVAKSLVFPRDVSEAYRHVLTTVDDGIRHEIEKKIKAEFVSKKNVKVHIKVKEGNPIDKVLRYVKIKNIDMILLGRKQNLQGSGLINSSIARNSPCHLLLIPEKTQQFKIDKMMIPVDFSKHSALAVQQGIKLANGDWLKKIFCAHVYHVPTGYSKSGKSFEEFSEIMLENAKKSYKRFIHDYGDIQCVFKLDDDGNPSKKIAAIMHEEKPDLVILGSKGRTDLATVFLGSMAEKFMLKDSYTPLLIIKRRDENMGLLEALMNI